MASIEELRLALIEFADWYHTGWLVARHRHRTPAPVRADHQPTRDLAAWNGLAACLITVVQYISRRLGLVRQRS